MMRIESRSDRGLIRCGMRLYTLYESCNFRMPIESDLQESLEKIVQHSLQGLGLFEGVSLLGD